MQAEPHEAHYILVLKAKTEFFEEGNGLTSHAHVQMMVVLFSHVNKSSLSMHVDRVNAAKKVVWTRIIPKIYYCEVHAVDSP